MASIQGLATGDLKRKAGLESSRLFRSKRQRIKSFAFFDRAEWRGEERRGVDRRGVDRKGLDWTGEERRGLDRRGEERRGQERIGLDWSGKEWIYNKKVRFH